MLLIICEWPRCKHAVAYVDGSAFSAISGAISESDMLGRDAFLRLVHAPGTGPESRRDARQIFGNV